jgi:hypothetical protein
MLPDGVTVLPGSVRVDGPGARFDAESPVPTVRAAALAPGGAVTLRFSVAAPAGAQANALARARRAGGELVQTPVVRSELDAPRIYTQSATWDEEPPPSAPAPEEAPPDAAFGDAWLAQAKPGNAWLYPPAGFIPKIPSVKIGVQHEPGLRVRLFRNGELVSPLNLDGVEQNAAKTVAVSRWRGVDLGEGPNVFLAELLDANGVVVQRIQSRVHSSGPPVRAELMPTLSQLVADGRTAPIVAVRLLDRWDQPVREGMSGPLQVAPPHRAQESVERSRDRKLAVPDLGASSFVVGPGGIARIALEPTSSVGRFSLTLSLAGDHREKIEGWLSPGRRDFTLVALGTGMRSFDQRSGNEDARRAAGASASDSGGRVALFASGTVRDDWQLTAAYDTDAHRTVPGKRLERTLDTQEHFALYGDDTEQRAEAPTSDGVFVKVQRDRFYALYGDFETALSESELARYERVVSGFKSEYYGDALRWNAFATDTSQSFARDEIRGNGTSGLYRLSQAPIVLGSDRVRIEVRDRFRPSRVVSTRPLVSQIDYDIDPYGGTLHFREPVPGRDESFNPVFIVAEYETAGGASAWSGGGRAGTRWLDGLLEVGASGIHEGRGTQSGDLVGVDATLRWSEATKLHAEWAGSEGESFLGPQRGQAWLVSGEHRSQNLELLAYAREQASGFGLGQLSAIDQGARRIGLDGRWRFREHWSLVGSAFHEQNLETSDERQIAESIVEWEDSGAGAHIGARYVHDSAPLAAANIGQVLLGGHYGFFDERLTLRLGTELGFGSEGEHGDYADRLALGVDFKLTEWLRLFAEHELTFGQVHRGNDTRVGATVTPWEGGQISASLGQQSLPSAGDLALGGLGGMGVASDPGPVVSVTGGAGEPVALGGREYGPRTYANLGVAQHWNLLQHWGFDLAVDRSQTLRGGNTAAFDPDVPVTSGTAGDDYTALSLGAGYSREDMAFTSRVEARMGQLEDQWSFTLGALREHERTSYAGHVELFSTRRGGANAVRDDLYSARLSLAYRPLDTRWIVLDQLVYERGNSEMGTGATQGDHVVNHFKLNYQLDGRTQLAWQYSAKWVGERIDGARYTTIGHLFGIESRTDVAPGWDFAVAARARLQDSRSSGEGRYSVGASIGRVLTKNVWASLGYNALGFRDDDFSQSDYTARGPFVRLRVKVDQDSVREWLDFSPRFASRVRNVFAANGSR